jgi:hypothetical protein
VGIASAAATTAMCEVRIKNSLSKSRSDHRDHECPPMAPSVRLRYKPISAKAKYAGPFDLRIFELPVTGTNVTSRNPGGRVEDKTGTGRNFSMDYDRRNKKIGSRLQLCAKRLKPLSIAFLL